LFEKLENALGCNIALYDRSNTASVRHKSSNLGTYWTSSRYLRQLWAGEVSESQITKANIINQSGAWEENQEVEINH
jgi:hypothetical protein